MPRRSPIARTWFLTGVIFYTKSLDSYLDHILDGFEEERARIDAFVASERPLFESPEDLAAFDEHSSEIVNTFSETYPTFFFNSFIILLMSFVEHELIVLSRKAKRLPKERVASGEVPASILDRLFGFLRMASGLSLFHKGKKGNRSRFSQMARELDAIHGISFPKETAEWERLQVYYKIRNIIVHRRGEIQKGDKGRVLSFLQEQGALGTDEDAVIKLTPELCRQALKDVRAFFIALDSGLPGELTN